MTLRKSCEALFSSAPLVCPSTSAHQVHIKCSMAEWSKCDWLPRDLALNELSLNELSWVMTLRLDAPASPAANAPALASPPSPTSPPSSKWPSRTGLPRKLSNRLSATTSRARRKLYVEELEARVAALEHENALLRAQQSAAERDNMLLQAEVHREHMLFID